MMPKLKYVGDFDTSLFTEKNIHTERISLNDAIKELEKEEYWYLDTETYAKDFNVEKCKEQFLVELKESKGKLLKSDTGRADKFAEKERSKIVLDTRKTTIRLLQIKAGDIVYILDTFLVDIQPIIEMIPKKCVGVQNGKYDLKIFKHQYDVLPYEVFDTMLGNRLIGLSKYDSYFKSDLGTIMREWEGLDLDKSFGKENWGLTITPEMVLYAYYDVAKLDSVVHKMIEYLNHHSVSKRKQHYFTTLQDRVATLEMRFLLELCRIELDGIPVNEDKLVDRYNEVVKERDIAMQECVSLIGCSPTSSDQIVKYLANEGVYTKNADEVALKDLEGKHHSIPYIQKVRKLNNEVISIDKFLKYIENGKIYPNFQQIKAGTGRMSASKPPVQGIPRGVKSYFYENKHNRQVLRVDYPAIEPRIMAVISGEKSWVDVFKNQGDIYKGTVSRILGIEVSEVTKSDRQKGKAIVLGLQYGMGKDTFKSYAYNTFGVEMTPQEATTWRNKFFQTSPKILQFHKSNGLKLNISKSIKGHTLLGRQYKTARFTTANNYPVQGTGADILKIAVVMYGEKIRELGLDAPIVNLIHDEIVINSSWKDKDRAGNVLKECMENACKVLIKEFDVLCEVEYV